MNREDLKADGYDKYQAYYRGELVRVYHDAWSTSNPTIEIQPGVMDSVSWDDLSSYATLPPPVINEFSASPNPVPDGEEFIISWSVSGADSIQIDGGWTTEPSGSMTKTAVYPRYYYYDQTLEIVAHNAWGPVRSSIKLAIIKQEKPKSSRPNTKPIKVKIEPNLSHICPEHPTVADAQYHAQQIEQEIESFLSDLETNSPKENKK